MLAIVLLGLIACDNAYTFKFRRVNESNDNFNTARNNHKIDVLNRRRSNIISREGNLNNEIINIKRQQEDLNRQIEYIKKQKDVLQSKTEFLTRQKEQLKIEMDKLSDDIKLVNGRRRNHADGIVEGNEFKITIYLSGCKEEDIVVKSKKGLLIVQAIHNVSGEPTNNYYYVISLPDFVEGNGRWLYTWGVLQIVFPIIQRLNKYPKLTIPLDNEDLSKTENGKPNTINQNLGNNKTKHILINSPIINSTKNNDPHNQEGEIKAIYDPNQDDHVEVRIDKLIKSNNLKVINIASQENGEEEATNHYVPGNFVIL